MRLLFAAVHFISFLLSCLVKIHALSLTPLPSLLLPLASAALPILFQPVITPVSSLVPRPSEGYLHSRPEGTSRPFTTQRTSPLAPPSLHFRTSIQSARENIPDSADCQPFRVKYLPHHVLSNSPSFSPCRRLNREPAVEKQHYHRSNSLIQSRPLRKASWFSSWGKFGA
jgi:hypothetical protein